MEQEEEKVCQKCNGTGIVREKGGSSHTCWDCLSEGRLDTHGTTVKDSGIKI